MAPCKAMRSYSQNKEAASFQGKLALSSPDIPWPNPLHLDKPNCL